MSAGASLEAAIDASIGSRRLPMLSILAVLLVAAAAMAFAVGVTTYSPRVIGSVLLAHLTGRAPDYRQSMTPRSGWCECRGSSPRP